MLLSACLPAKGNANRRAQAFQAHRQGLSQELASLCPAVDGVVRVWVDVGGIEHTVD